MKKTLYSFNNVDFFLSQPITNWKIELDFNFELARPSDIMNNTEAIQPQFALRKAQIAFNPVSETGSGVGFCEYTNNDKKSNGSKINKMFMLFHR